MTVALVGNARSMRDWSERIDACDIVLRMNNAYGFGDLTGKKVTHLSLINCGGQMHEWLEDENFLSRSYVVGADAIIFPIHPGKDELIDPPLTPAECASQDGMNYAVQATRHFRANGKRVTTLAVDLFLAALKVLGAERPARDGPAPSTGLLSLLHLLQQFPEEPINVFGFTFDGWNGHNWDAERRFFKACERDRMITLHPT